MHAGPIFTVSLLRYCVNCEYFQWSRSHISLFGTCSIISTEKLGEGTSQFVSLLDFNKLKDEYVGNCTMHWE
jgi:hypothetical protein